MWIGIVPACMYVHHVCLVGDHRSQERVLDPLGLELQTFVNCHMGTRNKIQVFFKRNSALNLWANFLAPDFIIYAKFY